MKLIGLFRTAIICVATLAGSAAGARPDEPFAPSAAAGTIAEVDASSLTIGGTVYPLGGVR